MSSGESDSYELSKRLQGLAAESVPYPHETKGYWYTRFHEAKKLLEETVEHHSDMEHYGACAYPCDLDQNIKEFLRVNALQTPQTKPKA